MLTKFPNAYIFESIKNGLKEERKHNLYIFILFYLNIDIVITRLLLTNSLLSLAY